MDLKRTAADSAYQKVSWAAQPVYICFMTIPYQKEQI